MKGGMSVIVFSNYSLISSMVDVFSKEKRSEIMSKIRSKNTRPELCVRKFVFSQGFRYRLHRNDLPGNPDLVFPKYRTIVFVHGCFWHGHKCKIGSGNRKPKTNKSYWIQKIKKNMLRDRNNRIKLKAMGWKVIIVWECETKNNHKVAHKLNWLLNQKNG